MHVRELTNWPPTIGGAHEPGSESPDPGQGVLIDVYPANGDRVTFRLRIGGQESNGHLKAHSVELAEKITEVLSQNTGKALAELGELKVN